MNEHTDTQPPAMVSQSAVNTVCEVAAGMTVPVALADNRPAWSTLMLEGPFYPPGTLPLVSRTKVRDVLCLWFLYPL